MLVKYLGTKPQKKIEWGEKIYIFKPTCVVTDKSLLLFLLHPDRAGLFEGDISKPLHEGAIPDQKAEAKPEEVKPAEKPKPKRKGRPKKKK